MTFRTKLFFTALFAALIALLVAGAFFAESMRQRTNERIEHTLVAEAKLTAELLERSGPAATAPPIPLLNEEAGRIGALLGARVTFIAPDGTVVGDSSETLAGLAAMENHGSRPEGLEARPNGARPAP